MKTEKLAYFDVLNYMAKNIIIQITVYVHPCCTMSYNMEFDQKYTLTISQTMIVLPHYIKTLKSIFTANTINEESINLSFSN